MQSNQHQQFQEQTPEQQAATNKLNAMFGQLIQLRFCKPQADAFEKCGITAMQKTLEKEQMPAKDGPEAIKFFDTRIKEHCPKEMQNLLDCDSSHFNNIETRKTLVNEAVNHPNCMKQKNEIAKCQQNNGHLAPAEMEKKCWPAMEAILSCGYSSMLQEAEQQASMMVKKK